MLAAGGGTYVLCWQQVAELTNPPPPHTHTRTHTQYYLCWQQVAELALGSPGAFVISHTVLAHGVFGKQRGHIPRHVAAYQHLRMCHSTLA